MLVSACLLGLCTRYDGSHARRREVFDALGARTAVAVCPEQLGGMATPRPRVEIRGGDGADVLDGRAAAVDEEGRDVTALMLRGAFQTLGLARISSAREALLKERSPSCGVVAVARGAGERSGRGVAAALLERNGIRLKGFS
ncbi:MAG TPA: DUF523 domain-containing protein [Deltaproteobacteria bacterium]|nr:DUF523 domain-containing protein [Deltaproteobacteria bacterium]